MGATPKTQLTTQHIFLLIYLNVRGHVLSVHCASDTLRVIQAGCSRKLRDSLIY